MERLHDLDAMWIVLKAIAALAGLGVHLTALAFLFDRRVAFYFFEGFAGPPSSATTIAQKKIRWRVL